MKHFLSFRFGLKKRISWGIEFLLFFFFFCFSNGLACELPVEFLKLNKDLKLAISQYELKIKIAANQNSPLFQKYENSDKRKNFKEDIKSIFPPDFITLFVEYEANVKVLDAIDFSVLDDSKILSESEKKGLAYLSKLHLYMVSDLLPQMIYFKYKDFPFFESVDSKMESQGYLLIQEIKSAFEKVNLKKCKDEAGSNKLGLEDPNVLISTMSESVESKDGSSEKTLSNPQKPTAGDVFKSHYDGDEDEEANTAMTVRSEEVKGNKLMGWIKNFLGFFSSDKSADRTKITSDLYSKNIVFIGAKQKNLNIMNRYTDFQNNRNFWIHRTREVSGEKTDVFTQKFTKIVDLIEKTNKELDRSLTAISTTCKKQKIKTKCWGSSNAKPK